MLNILRGGGVGDDGLGEESGFGEASGEGLPQLATNPSGSWPFAGPARKSDGGARAPRWANLQFGVLHPTTVPWAFVVKIDSQDCRWGGW